MISLRRLALGFPLSWTHRRIYGFAGREVAGTGPYYVHWDASSGVFGEDWATAPRDAAGVILTGRHYHPIRIAQFALHRYGQWLATRDDAARADFLAHASWLRDNQQTRGVPGLYRFSFAWDKYGAQAGWWSAMAQGEAISVLLRAEHIAPRHQFGDAAVRASLPFGYEIARGGVVWRAGADVFFEEIANEYAPHVLNGCIFALWGLWELREQTRDPWLDPLIDGCAATLARWLPRFDTGWWTLYSLLQSANGRPHLATLKYHQFHIAQMYVLGQMFPEHAFADAAHRWAGYVENRRCRAKLLCETLLGIPDRAFKRDTVARGART